MEYSELCVKRIRSLCRARGIAINKLANMSDVKQSTLGDIMRGLLRQHRTIWQAHSVKDFASAEGYKRAGILDVFPSFITARMGQKIGRRPKTQLCGVALRTPG